MRHMRLKQESQAGREKAESRKEQRLEPRQHQATRQLDQPRGPVALAGGLWPGPQLSVAILPGRAGV